MEGDMKKMQGFTLIEVMIVVAVIGILAAMIIPSYQHYIQKTLENACLMELKGYANQTFLAINDQDETTNPSIPVVSACKEITDASAWDLDTSNKILIAIPKNSGAKKSQCNLDISPSCTLVP